MAAEGPRLPFDVAQTVELVLPVGELPSELVFDYRSDFAFWVTEVELAYDFDRTLAIDSPAVTFDTACPPSVATSELVNGLPEEGVFSGLLTATDERTGSIREARLTFTRGNRSLTLELPEAAAVEAPALVLYEPAEGRSRVAIARAQWGSVIQVAGLPSGLAEVAVVAAKDVVFDEEDDAFYVPDDFGESWRSRVSPWFGAVVSDDSEQAIKLTEIRAVGEPVDALPGVQDREALSGTRTSVLLAVLDPFTQTTVEVPCTSEALQATMFGFAEVTDGAETAARGEPLKVSIECDTGTAEIDLSITVQNQRIATLLLELL